MAGSSGDVDDPSDGTYDHLVMVSTVVELGSVVIDVDGERLDARFIDDKGDIRDYFTILKERLDP